MKNERHSEAAKWLNRARELYRIYQSNLATAKYNLLMSSCDPYETYSVRDYKIEIEDCRYMINELQKEIKQNKEDMEEKKLNLKPFDLEAAKAGKPVCTRDGRKARIICFDRNWDMNIVALVSNPLGESVHYYLSNGKVDFYRQNDEDLMMLPEKKEGWVNVYRSQIYDTFERATEAYKRTCNNDNYLQTIKISWEE